MQKPQLRIKKRTDGYFFKEIGPSSEIYHGRIYCLVNDDSAYAIIFDREIQALSGPPGRLQQLLCVGEGIAPLGKDDFLQMITEEAVLQQAQKLATERGLDLESSLSQPKCTMPEEQDMPRPYVNPQSPGYHPWKKGGDNPDPRKRY
jgi:hypothetical protein